MRCGQRFQTQLQSRERGDVTDPSWTAVSHAIAELRGRQETHREWWFQMQVLSRKREESRDMRDVSWTVPDASTESRKGRQETRCDL